MELLAVHLLTLVGFTRIAELFPVLAPLHLGKVAFALGGVALAVCLGRGRGARALLDAPLAGHVLLLFLLAGLSVPMSVWRSGALESMQGAGKTVFVFAVLALAGARTGGNSVRWALMVGVLLLGGMMVAEKGSGRAFVSSTYDANDIALLFAMFLPVLCAEGVAGRGLSRVVAWGAACAALLGMAMTQSRGGVVALGVVALHMVWTSRRRGVLLVALCAVAVIFYLNTNAAFWDRFALVGDAADDYNMTADTGRLHLWKSGLAMLLGNPLFGVGVGQFGAANYMFGNGAYLTAHNTYLQVAAEMGLPALAVYVSMLRRIVSFAREGAASPALDAPERVRWLGVRYGITAFMIGIFFVSQAFAVSFYCFMALVSAMRSRQESLEALAVTPAEPAQADSRGAGRKGGRARSATRHPVPDRAGQGGSGAGRFGLFPADRKDAPSPQAAERAGQDP